VVSGGVRRRPEPGRKLEIYAQIPRFWPGARAAERSSESGGCRPPRRSLWEGGVLTRAPCRSGGGEDRRPTSGTSLVPRSVLGRRQGQKAEKRDKFGAAGRCFGRRNEATQKARC